MTVTEDDLPAENRPATGASPRVSSKHDDPDSRRTWFLTWTTYGSWLPGDDRGFAGTVRGSEGTKRTTRENGGAAHLPNERLEATARRLMVGQPIVLQAQQAEIIEIEVVRSCGYRRWHFSALAVMPNHIHVIITAANDPNPDDIVRDLKAYASRALNHQFPRPRKGWWTRGASKRVLKTEQELLNTIRYVRDQAGALVIRVDPEYQR